MAFDYSKEWHKSEPEKVVDLIKEVGIHRLGRLDGCLCCFFSVRNVDIQIACGKGSERGVSVGSGSMDYEGDVEMLRPIAEEVRRQCEELDDGRGDMPIRLQREYIQG